MNTPLLEERVDPVQSRLDELDRKDKIRRIKEVIGVAAASQSAIEYHNRSFRSHDDSVLNPEYNDNSDSSDNFAKNPLSPK